MPESFCSSTDHSAFGYKTSKDFLHSNCGMLCATCTSMRLFERVSATSCPRTTGTPFTNLEAKAKALTMLQCA